MASRSRSPGRRRRPSTGRGPVDAGPEGRLETCILAGLCRDRRALAEAESSLKELERLAQTAGADSVGSMLQVRESPDPATFVGKGRAAELAEEARAAGAELVVFDDELSPAQQRNLEEICGLPVIDRTGLILDIFAQHARSAEGKIQVELAQHRYRLPRLRGRGTQLSRLGGGIGTRGPGEQKLEVDRRRIRQRISVLESELEKLDRTRRTKRKQRIRSALPQIALVGYTNAGKSTLLNRLTKADVLVEDKLFSTLDPTTRRVRLPDGTTAVISDTVGFVRKLPHQLVEAFRSTLEEVVEATLLLHIVDASAPDNESQIRAVRGVLAEIGAAGLPELVVANKADIASAGAIARLQAGEPDCVAVSARTGKGVSELLGRIGNSLESARTAGVSSPSVG